MTPRLTMNIMLILSVCYGAAVAIVAVTDSDALGTFAVIGAIVLGALWAARSFLIRGSR
ncbi:hypothetical protein [Dactylosporangium sp. NPDC049140]|jgi:hypothetical protein|uniref:hypothetical protein n=1 Tax=Dactylosporangium sp. NPDC049140 TaxID=3155647 RepID=UPI0033F0B8C1